MNKQSVATDKSEKMAMDAARVAVDTARSKLNALQSDYQIEQNKWASSISDLETQINHARIIEKYD